MYSNCLEILGNVFLICLALFYFLDTFWRFLALFQRFLALLGDILKNSKDLRGKFHGKINKIQKIKEKTKKHRKSSFS